MSIKLKDILASEFRFSVMVQRATYKPDNSGGQGAAVWNDCLEIYCKVAPWKGREEYSDGSTGRIRTEQYWMFYSWFRSEIKETDRLLFQGKLYNIRSLDNVELRNKFLAISAESGVEQ